MSPIACFRVAVPLCAALVLAACGKESAPPAPAGEAGVILIATEPGDARIVIDGREHGRTPAETGATLALRLPDGRYTVQAHKEADESSEFFAELEIAHAAERPQPPVTLRLERRLTAAGEAARAAGQAWAEDRERILAARYELHDDGTATDAEFGLMWMRCSVGQHWDGNGCTGEATKLSWSNAVKAGEGLAFAGHGDWRLPTREELVALTHCSSGRRFARDKEGSGGSCEGAYRRPTILEAVFPNTPIGNFWSATPHDNYSHASWGVAFANGATGIGARTEYVFVRLVRDLPAAGR